MPAFELTKWYLDVCSSLGEVAIGYVADLRLGTLRVGYQSLLTRHPEEPACVVTSYRAGALPDEKGGVIGWTSAPLKVSGRWEARGGPVERTVIEAPEGLIRWRCRQPRSQVELTHPGGTLAGLGYAEVLTMTLPPWNMPIRELWWGRMVAEGVGLTWIDWRGPHNFKSVILNGQEAEGAVVSSDGVTGNGMTLRFEDTQVLRAGTLGTTALSLLPDAVKRHLLGRVLFIDETKWVSRGVLSRAGQDDVEGWVIHEVVRWP